MGIGSIWNMLRKGDAVVVRSPDGARTGQVDREATYALPDDAPAEQFVVCWDDTWNPKTGFARSLETLGQTCVYEGHVMRPALR